MNAGKGRPCLRRAEPAVPKHSVVQDYCRRCMHVAQAHEPWRREYRLPYESQMHSWEEGRSSQKAELNTQSAFTNGTCGSKEVRLLGRISFVHVSLLSAQQPGYCGSLHQQGGGLAPAAWFLPNKGFGHQPVLQRMAFA